MFAKFMLILQLFRWMHEQLMRLMQKVARFYTKNATKRYPIASVIKILTLGVILQDIRNHYLKWDQKIKITPVVAKMADDWHFSNVPLMNGEEYQSVS